jgi:hypothetical protein
MRFCRTSHLRGSLAQLLAGEGFAVSHVQVFKDYRTLKSKS